MIDEDAIRTRYEAMAGVLDERARRLLLGAEARAAGRGGQAAVARATGASAATIRRGRAGLGESDLPRGRVRRAGGGRKRAVDLDPTLLADLEALVEPGSRGDPEFRWSNPPLPMTARRASRSARFSIGIGLGSVASSSPRAAARSLSRRLR